MIFPKASGHFAGRLCQRTLRNSRAPIRRRTWSPFQSRTNASASGGGSHGAHKPSSDLPWAIVSIGFTVPAVWYLIQPQLQPKKSHSHGHGDENEAHGEHDSPEETSQEGQESTTDEDSSPDSASERAQESNKGDNTSDTAEEGKSKDTEKGDDGTGESSDSSGGAKQAPATPSDHGPDDVAHEKGEAGDVDGVQFKGATSGGTRDGVQGDTRKHIPDAKGGNKIRLESDYGKQLGGATDSTQDHEGDDMAASAKPAGKAGSSNSQSSKQEGLSNTDTKHSTDIQNDPGKSKKGEGMPETAKSKGTVDPFRKQV